jgi:hypothetical protein
LEAAGTLINKVKSHNYDESDKAPEEFYESIDQLALAFSSRYVNDKHFKISLLSAVVQVLFSSL